MVSKSERKKAHKFWVKIHLIEDSVLPLVTAYEENLGIIESNDTIRKRASEWYDRSDNPNITDPFTLAAVTVYGNYDSSLNFADVRNLREQMVWIGGNNV